MNLDLRFCLIVYVPGALASCVYLYTRHLYSNEKTQKGMGAQQVGGILLQLAFGTFMSWVTVVYVCCFSHEFRQGVRLRLNRADRKNPHHSELRQAIRYLRELHGVPGELAANQRHELVETITNLRKLSGQFAIQDAEARQKVMRPEYDNLRQLGERCGKVYAQAHREVLGELAEG